MGYLIASALISSAVALFFVRHARSGGIWGSDSDFDGPQKFHSVAVPRLGGVGILIALAGCATFALWQTRGQQHMALLVACGIPAIAYGLAEDLTLSVSPRKRFFATAISALLGVYVLGAVIHRTDIAVIDGLLGWSWLAIPLTVFAVSGLANSINIIDGFNGLAAMVCILMFAAIACVAYRVEDSFILMTALSCIGALVGFFIWNFPRGLIFLGDGGAYFMGFMLAELAILLCQRHAEVSPWFALLVFFYPIVETVFSIYRRRIIKGVSIASPDAFHLHSLIFRRLLKARIPGEAPSVLLGNRNSTTSLYLWALSLVAVAPAVVFWNSTPMLMLFCAVFIGVYCWIYQSIVRFRTPAWLAFR